MGNIQLIPGMTVDGHVSVAKCCLKLVLAVFKPFVVLLNMEIP